jgi:hypothetical protein
MYYTVDPDLGRGGALRIEMGLENTRGISVKYPESMSINYDESDH